MRVPRGCGLALSIAALAIAGCGGEDDEQGRLSKAEYQAAILDVAEDSSAPTSLYTDLVVRSRPRAECESMMARFHDQVSDLVERIAALEPPAPVTSIHDDFVRAARQSVARVGTIEDEVAAGEVSCGRELNDVLYGMASSNRAERAIAALEKHGYFLGGE